VCLELYKAILAFVDNVLDWFILLFYYVEYELGIISFSDFVLSYLTW
jgi:hypothetical protein